ncbi:MAG TPA: hypothetical protein DCF33_10965, partial [Saprospirales bacterium]|nr:hypothetical protein [Saprospirales bacterium]
YDSPNDINYTGAWANVIVKAQNISDSLNIIQLGLSELNFEVIFIDKIENIASLIEYNEINNTVLAEVNWLSKSKFVFMISDKLFPYVEDNSTL